MAYDSWDHRPASPALRLGLAGVFAASAAAVAFSVYVYQHQRTLVQDERDARVAEVSTLSRRLDRLVKRDASLTGQLRSTRQELQTKQHDLAPLAKRVLESVFTVYTDSGLGSGFVGWTDGSSSYVITARHVVATSLGGFVTLSRSAGGSWQGEIQAEDEANDLAVIRIDGRPAGAAPLWQLPDTTPPRPGDSLLLVGSPYGLAGTVTTGVVSRVTTKVIQTDAAANPGNSGGPAVDEQGHVVGVVVARISPELGSGVNFAVPIARVCAELRTCD